MITSVGGCEGPDRFRVLYGGLPEECGSIGRCDSPGFSFDALHVRNDTLFITRQAESMHHVLLFGTDTLVFEGGEFDRLQSAAAQEWEIR